MREIHDAPVPHESGGHSTEYDRMRADYDRMKHAEEARIVERSETVASLRASLERVTGERGALCGAIVRIADALGLVSHDDSDDPIGPEANALEVVDAICLRGRAIRAEASRLRGAVEELREIASRTGDYYGIPGSTVMRITTAALSPAPGEVPTCTWTQDSDGTWETTCGEAWVTLDGEPPADHRVRFCHGCGRRTAFAPYAPEPEEEDEPAPLAPAGEGEPCPSRSAHSGTLCGLALGHDGMHIRDDGEAFRAQWDDDHAATPAPAEGGGA